MSRIPNNSLNIDRLNNLLDIFITNTKVNSLQNQQAKLNLSLSHGLAGKILTLSKFIKLNINHPELNDVLYQCIKIYISSENSPNSVSMYPNTLGKNIHKSSRLAWCYGDLGAGMAFWYAGEVLGLNYIKNKAVDIYLKNVDRKSAEETLIIDGGICHGMAGVAVMYNRMYINSRFEIFKDTSNFWLSKTADYCLKSSKRYNYKAWWGDKLGWIMDDGLLMGSSGIALTLLSINNSSLISWDSCLLIS